MMTTELHVQRKTIEALFAGMEEKKFIIPEYQRPYNWDKNKECARLWDDIIEADTKNDYFLGAFVTLSRKNGDTEIIDGQQRATSLLLLLRAFYKKLEKPAEKKYADALKELKRTVKSCIWHVDPASGEVKNNKDVRIKSLVITEDSLDVFHHILATGDIPKDIKGKNHYAENYQFFRDRWDEYASATPDWHNLCIFILDRCIVFSIVSENPDMALKIFQTLNNRGLPLEDADIFKAQIYKTLSVGERKKFAKQWKELTQTCKKGRIKDGITEVFRYYSHVLRGRGKISTPEKRLRDFYAEPGEKGIKYERLTDPVLLNEIRMLANFWQYANTGARNKGIPVFTPKIRQYLNILSAYLNEEWKYPVCAFFLKHKGLPSKKFNAQFLPLLEKLTAYLLTMQLWKPGINNIKPEIYRAYIAIFHNKEGWMPQKIAFDIDRLRSSFDDGKMSGRGLKAFLLLHAYLHPAQKNVLPEKIDIEHILPRSWKQAKYGGLDFANAKLTLNSLGNLVVLEKESNIKASDGFFGKKRKEYESSKISVVKDLLKHRSDDWGKDDIEKRDKEVKDTLFDFFKKQLSKKGER